MIAARWQPFTSLWSEVSRLNQDVDRLFDSYRFERGWPGFTPAYPALNVWEDEGNVYVEAELPGMAEDDLEVYVTGGNQLTLKGERKQPRHERGHWHRQERGFGSFTRLVTLPGPVDADRVSAAFSHGVMTITLPKAESAKPRRITVKSE